MAKEILILQNVVLHYRKALYNLLSENYNITVLHSGKPSITDEDKYSELIVKKTKLGPFHVQREVLKEIRKEKYDVVIAMFDLRWLNNFLAFFLYRRKIKFIWWGAWFTESKIANKIRTYITKQSDASIFYTEDAKLDFVNNGVDQETLFVANNTFDVGKRRKCYESKIKNSILFVGSLNKRKQNDILINAFSNILEKIPKEIRLIIIGDGPEKEELIVLSKRLKLGNRIEFTGKISDSNKLLDYYEKAIVAVSFGQAGLAVLQSLGFGVPFLTKENAISGGEKTNIIHGENSFFCKDDIISLEESLMQFCLDIDYARKIGKNAFEYYSKFCTIENMSQGFISAIESPNY